MVVSFGDLRRGMTIEMDGAPYQVVEYSSHKMQQRAPVIRLRLRELRTGRTVDRSFNGYDVKLTLADVERRPAQYIYQDNELYYFMDTASYEQFPLTADRLGEALKYLKDQMELEVLFYKDQPIAVDLPTFVALKVVDTPPPAKGDTAQGSTKPAKLDTGLNINVPFFVGIGDVVRVDTRTGNYLERV
jgi:elongation factor P